MTIIVQDLTTLRQFNLTIAVKADEAMINVQRYVSTHYPNLHIVGRA